MKMVKKRLVPKVTLTIDEAIAFLRDLSAQLDSKIKKMQEDKAKIDLILKYLTSPEEVEEYLERSELEEEEEEEEEEVL